MQRRQDSIAELHFYHLKDVWWRYFVLEKKESSCFLCYTLFHYGNIFHTSVM